MHFHLTSQFARALALALLLAGVLALAAGNAAWASPAEDNGRPQRGRSTVPRREADLSITKSFVALGPGDYVFMILVRNNGPIAARDVVVSDFLSRFLEFASIRTSQGICRTGQHVTCRLGDLAAGQAAVVTIHTDLWLSQFQGTITNRATVGARTRDTHTRNNFAVVSLRVP